MSLIDTEIRRQAYDRAAALGLLGELEESERLFRELLRTDPGDRATARNLGIVLLSRGNFKEGAALYGARLAMPRADTSSDLPYPLWKGEPLGGKGVLIWPEQGLGDQIMFARFVPELQRRGCDVTILCHPMLERLFRDSLEARVIRTVGTVDFPDPDVWIWSNSLLSALVGDERDIPGAPYLRAPTTMPVPFRIGVASRGNPEHANDAARSMSPEAAQQLLALPGCGSLLPEHTGARDFSETAAIIAGLDLVISVDTSIAHLAGALGRPCWILLPAAGTDWRWMRDREDSPWYPAARLLRQPVHGDWASVLDRIRAELPTASEAR